MGYKIKNRKEKIKSYRQVLKNTSSAEIWKKTESLWGKGLQGINFRCQELQ